MSARLEDPARTGGTMARVEMAIKARTTEMGRANRGRAKKKVKEKAKPEARAKAKPKGMARAGVRATAKARARHRPSRQILHVSRSAILHQAKFWLMKFTGLLHLLIP